MSSTKPGRCSRWPTATSACAATSTRASHRACRAPTSTVSTKQRALPYAEAGYGYPEAGQSAVNVTNGKIIRLLVDDEPFDVRSGDAAQPRAGAGFPRRRAATPRRVGIAGRPAGARLFGAPGLARAAGRRRRPLRGRAARCPGAAGGAVGARGQRADAGAAADPRAAPQLGAALRSEQFSDHDARAVLVHITQQSALRMAAGDGSRRRRARPGPRRRPRAARISARADDHGRRASRASGCGWSSCWPTGGRAGARRRRCATRSPLRWPRRATPAGRGCSPASAAISTTSGSAPTSSSKVTPSSSRRCASRSFTPCRRAPGASGARSPPRA